MGLINSDEKIVQIDKNYGDPIEVEWIDAYADATWQSVEDAMQIPDETYCRTLSYFIGINEGFLIIASTIGKSEDNDIGGVWKIPLKWIIKVK